jgi:ubiquinone/menaquinone biosynthesis C-methylase UbiE
LARSSGAISFFDTKAQEYLAAYREDSLAGYVLRTRRARVLDLLGEINGRVLDVGCGPGAMTEEILDAGCEFWGVDGSLRMIVEGRRRFSGCAQANFGVADAVALPFADATFDGALCVGVIDRVSQPEAVMMEVGRVLKPRGTLVIAFPNFLSPYALWRSHVFYAGIGCAKRVLGRFGKRRRGLDLCSAAGLWTPWAARRMVGSLVGEVREIAYYHFGVFPAPLDELLPGAALGTARWLERLRKTPLRWLGSGFLVMARRSSA